MGDDERIFSEKLRLKAMKFLQEKVFEVQFDREG